MFKNLRPTLDPYNSLSEFVWQFLCSIPRDFLSNTLSLSTKKQSTKEVLESYWQAEFYRVACALLNYNTHISVEVGKVDDVKIDGKVDFYLNGTRKWAVEFLIRGELSKKDNAIEHVSRFQTGGKYHALQPNQYLVVDFRPSSLGGYEDLKSTQDTQKTNLWVVVYDDKQWEHLYVTKYDETGKQTEHKKPITLVTEKPSKKQ